MAGDRDGNVLLNNNLGVDLELMELSETVIVTVERMVDRLERTTDGLLIPAPGATHVALAPRGAYPTSCYPDYPVGGGEFMRYVDACNAGKFDEYLAEFLAILSTMSTAERTPRTPSEGSICFLATLASSQLNHLFEGKDVLRCDADADGFAGERRRLIAGGELEGQRDAGGGLQLDAVGVAQKDRSP